MARPQSPADPTTLLDAFVACRTTLYDLARRTAALGSDLGDGAIAAMLTGRSVVSDLRHDAVAAAINARLSELALPPRIPYRHQPDQ